MSAVHREWRESRLRGMTTTLRKIRAAAPCPSRSAVPRQPVVEASRIWTKFRFEELK